MLKNTLRAAAVLALVAAVAAPVAVAAPAPAEPPAPPSATAHSSLRVDGRMSHPVADEELRDRA